MLRAQTLNNLVHLLGCICITRQRPHRAAASVNVRCSPLCVSPLWDEGVEQRGQP